MIKIYYSALFLLVGSLFSEAIAQPINIKVSTTQVLEKSYLGNGVQWSPYPVLDISESDWQRVFDRLDCMKLNFVRVMVPAEIYCLTYSLG